MNHHHQIFIRIYYNHHYYLRLVQHFHVHQKHLFIVLINDEYRKVFSSLFLNLTENGFFFSILKEELDSPSSHRSQSHSNSLNHTPKSTPIHPTILSGDVTPSSLNLPPPLLIPSSSLNESKDNDLSTTDIMDDGNTSDSSINGNNENICDDGPAPLTCDRG
jgi:hypothetical protein